MNKLHVHSKRGISTVYSSVQIDCKIDQRVRIESLKWYVVYTTSQQDIGQFFKSPLFLQSEIL